MSSLNLNKLTIRELLDIKESLEILNKKNDYDLSINHDDSFNKSFLVDKKKLIISKLNDVLNEIETRLLK